MTISMFAEAAQRDFNQMGKETTLAPNALFVQDPSTKKNFCIQMNNANRQTIRISDYLRVIKQLKELSNVQ